MTAVHPLIIVWWTCVLLLILLVLLRLLLLARTHRLTHPNSQDFFLLLTCILSVSVAGVGTAFLSAAAHARARFGPLGVLLLSNAEKERILRLAWVGHLLSILVLCIAKATLFSLYLTVYARLPRGLRVALAAGVAYAAAGTLALFCANLLHCGTDLSVNWRIEGLDAESYRSRCVAQSSTTLSILLTIFSVSVDVLLMVLGYLTLRLLHISGRREYVALTFVFAIGLLSIISSLVRFGNTVTRLGRAVNPSWTGIEFYTTWISIETMCAALACSLPSLRGLIHQAVVAAHQSGSGGSAGSTVGQSFSRRRGSAPGFGAKVLVNEVVELRPVRLAMEV
ncbi:hypothetical protein EDC01DRAFT_310271 [Geopyxis carbonaria]|nr:hypothetical protein EDC01DRAFT_310271 [Geopyxis carbonaria]